MSGLRGRASLLSLVPYTKAKTVLEYHPGSEKQKVIPSDFLKICVQEGQSHRDEMGSQCLGFILVFAHPSEFPANDELFTAYHMTALAFSSP